MQEKESLDSAVNLYILKEVANSNGDKRISQILKSIAMDDNMYNINDSYYYKVDSDKLKDKADIKPSNYVGGTWYVGKGTGKIILVYTDATEVPNYVDITSETLKNTVIIEGNIVGEADTEVADNPPLVIEPAYIPAGFIHKEGTIEEGFVITDDEENEFVWVPVQDDRVPASMSVVYGRYDFQKNAIFSSYFESDNTQIHNSVDTYKGFYIARYEIGTTIKRTSDKDSLTTGYSKKGLDPYNYIKRVNAGVVATNMKNTLGNSGTDVTPIIISSYLWDTTLKWIETEYPTYPTDSKGKGNYGDGESATTIKTTGYDTEWKVKNIYDMGGNVSEWTTESYVDNTNGVYRGAFHFYADVPAGNRNGLNATNTNADIGFRIVLYK